MIQQFTPRYISPKTESRDSNTYLHTNVHSSIIHNSQKWKQSKYPSIDEVLNKMWYIHTIKYYLALNEILTHVTTWMNLENMLNEISETNIA